MKDKEITRRACLIGALGGVVGIGLEGVGGYLLEDNQTGDIRLPIPSLSAPNLREGLGVVGLFGGAGISLISLILVFGQVDTGETNSTNKINSKGGEHHD